jgi:hypothetical protein
MVVLLVLLLAMLFNVTCRDRLVNVQMKDLMHGKQTCTVLATSLC